MQIGQTQIVCGEVHVVSTASFITIPNQTTTIDTSYIKITLVIDNSKTRKPGYSYQISKGEIEITLFPSSIELAQGSGAPVFLGHYQTKDEKKRLYLSFAFTKIMGYQHGHFHFSVYLSPDGASKYDWE